MLFSSKLLCILHVYSLKILAKFKFPVLADDNFGRGQHTV